MVKDSLIIFIEAQSSWSINISIRLLLYIALTLKEYFIKTDQNLYGSKPVKLPNIEAYVVYSGDRKDIPKKISLVEDFFKGEHKSFDISCKVISETGNTNIITQYITFCKILREELKKYKNQKEAIVQTINICKDKNILKTYLTKNEGKVVMMLGELFDQEQIFNTYVRCEVREGEARGIKLGEKKGKIIQFIETSQEYNETREKIEDRLVSKFHLTPEEAKKYYEKYKK